MKQEHSVQGLILKKQHSNLAIQPKRQTLYRKALSKEKLEEKSSSLVLILFEIMNITIQVTKCHGFVIAVELLESGTLADLIFFSNKA